MKNSTIGKLYMKASLTSPTTSGNREALLLEYHRKHTGKTHEVLSDFRNTLGKNSYELLTDACLSKYATRVLDIGCGNATLYPYLKDRTKCTYHGLDISENELSAASQTFHELKEQLVLGRAQNMPFENDMFDVVVSHMSLMVIDQPQRVLKEIDRVLSPQGCFIFLVNDANLPDGLLKRSLDTAFNLLPEKANSFQVDPRLHCARGVREFFEECELNGYGIDTTRHVLKKEVDASDLEEFVLSQYCFALLEDEIKQKISGELKTLLGSSENHTISFPLLIHTMRAIV